MSRSCSTEARRCLAQVARGTMGGTAIVFVGALLYALVQEGLNRHLIVAPLISLIFPIMMSPWLLALAVAAATLHQLNSRGLLGARWSLELLVLLQAVATTLLLSGSYLSANIGPVSFARIVPLCFVLGLGIPCSAYAPELFTAAPGSRSQGRALSATWTFELPIVVLMLVLAVVVFP